MREVKGFPKCGSTEKAMGSPKSKGVMCARQILCVYGKQVRLLCLGGLKLRKHVQLAVDSLV